MAWARRETILKEVNSDGQEEISMSTLMKELGHLLDAGHIERYRQDGKRGLYYHVVTMSVGKPLELPHPSEILDPVYQGRPVDVINPLTGSTEKI
jgi:predicted transcriptional regulator